MAIDEISFGRFRLDLQRRELSRDGAPIRIGGRALDILCVLASAKGELVSKDQLMAQVWSGQVVEDNALQAQVSSLRKALGDDAEGTPFVMAVPGRGYRLIIPAPLAAPSAGSDPPLNIPGTTIAVLPFQNMSGDPEQEYFADGIVEDIITGLARMQWLSVTARNSCFVYKGKPVDIKQVGSELGVRYVLEGSVRKVGNRVRMTGQLINAQTGVHVWADRYDRLLDDIFAVQDELTMSVIGALEPSLKQAEIERVRRKRPENLDAYDLVLRALPHLQSRMASDAASAAPLLHKAIELEPNYTGAHAFLARCYHHIYRRGGLRSDDQLAAIRHAHAAVSRGDDDATTLALAGWVIWLEERDIDRGLDLLDRALALSPSNAIALGMSASMLAWMGQSAAAIERAQRALKLSPFDTVSAYAAVIVANFYERRFDAALEAAKRSAEANSNFSIAHLYVAIVLAVIGRLVEANAAAKQVLVLDPKFTIYRWKDEWGHMPAYGSMTEALRAAGIPET